MHHSLLINFLVFEFEVFAYLGIQVIFIRYIILNIIPVENRKALRRGWLEILVTVGQTPPMFRENRGCSGPTTQVEDTGYVAHNHWVPFGPPNKYMGGVTRLCQTTCYILI